MDRKNGSADEQFDDAQEILDALREIQETPELRAEAQANPEGLLDRLRLSGAARHAVALGIASLLVSSSTAKHIQPTGFWSG
jgi:hypothetical protein